MDNSSLGRLKGIAAGGKARPEKPMALRPADNESDDTLELRVDNIVEDAEFEEMGNEEAALKEGQERADDQVNTTEISPEKAETVEAKAPAANEVPAMQEGQTNTPPVELPTAPATASAATDGEAPAAAAVSTIVTSDSAGGKTAAPEGDINDLITGKLLPHVSLPITKAGNYDVMNEMLKKGKVNLGEVDGAPHIILTANALDDIIDEKKNNARGTVEAIEKTENDISELEQRIESLKEERGTLLEAASVSREEIATLQNLRSGLK